MPKKKKKAKKKTFVDKLEAGIRRAGGVLGSGFDWYLGADLKHKKGTRIGSQKVYGVKGERAGNEPYVNYLITGKKPKKKQEQEQETKTKKSKSGKKIHITIET
jgi:hypothetical protein